ncbi:MAG: hypothetical protein ACLFV8_08785 [Alphaproteobacteria bacterium]
MNGRRASIPARATRRTAGGKGAALIARGDLDIFDDRLEFNSWRLPVHAIINARFERRLAKRDGRWTPKGNRLRFTCGGHDYKFKLDGLEDLRGQLPFPVQDREVRLKPAGPLFYGIVLLLIALAYGAHGLLG